MKTMKIVMSKFPHLSNVKNTISSMQREIELLNKRKRLWAAEIENKTPFEQNELELLILRTDRELSRLFKGLNEQENHFKNYKSKLDDNIKQLNLNYDEFVEECKKLKSSNEDIKNAFEQYAVFDFNENYEAKVMFYASLKHALEPKPEKESEKVLSVLH
jgi:hypothetical protein